MPVNDSIEGENNRSQEEIHSLHSAEINHNTRSRSDSSVPAVPLDESGLPAKLVGEPFDSSASDVPKPIEPEHSKELQQQPLGSSSSLRSSSNEQRTTVRDHDEDLSSASMASPQSMSAQKPDADILESPNGPAHWPQVEQQPSAAVSGMIHITGGRSVTAAGGVSDWSHQALAPHKAVSDDDEEEEKWQDMPAFAPYDLYDDDGKLIAREERESDGEGNAYAGLGGAGKGYTRVQVDEDARSATSMDDNTSYLFKANGTHIADEDDEQRDPLAQMQATKDLLTEGQRIAYVGVVRLAMVQMVKELDRVEGTKGTKKEFKLAVEAMKMWSQKMMLRLYAHMEINSSGNLDRWLELNMFIDCLQNKS